MENKEFELSDENLDQVTGGSGEGPFGSSPLAYPKGCPICGSDVYYVGGILRVELDDGSYAYTSDFVCENWDYWFSKDGRPPIGYQEGDRYKF